MTIKGYSDKAKSSAGLPDYATLGPVREQQFGIDTIAHAFAQLIGGGTVGASSTTRTVNATAHGALVGDIISFTSGALNTKEYRAQAVTTNTITLAELASSAPAAADTFNVLRPKFPVVSAAGALTLSVTSVGIAGKVPGGVVTKTWTGGAPLSTASYTQLFAAASVTAAVTRVHVGDTGGQFLILATGGSGSEVDQIYLSPGFGGFIDWTIPAGTRIALKALNTNATSGTFIMTLFG